MHKTWTTKNILVEVEHSDMRIWREASLWSSGKKVRLLISASSTRLNYWLRRWGERRSLSPNIIHIRIFFLLSALLLFLILSIGYEAAIPTAVWCSWCFMYTPLTPYLWVGSEDPEVIRMQQHNSTRIPWYYVHKDKRSSGGVALIFPDDCEFIREKCSSQRMDDPPPDRNWVIWDKSFGTFGERYYRKEQYDDETWSKEWQEESSRVEMRQSGGERKSNMAGGMGTGLIMTIG